MGLKINTTYSFWDKGYPDTEWVEYMNNSIKELVDLYQPDILWGDIGPKADGTIPEVMQDRLMGTGDWLSVNGEAIYGTKLWKVYGEGPTNEEIGSWDKQDGEYRFKSGDIRFTRKENILYEILLEWHGSKITINSLKRIKINKLTMLGSDEKIICQQINEGLTVTLPSNPVSPYANTLKLECAEMSLDAELNKYENFKIYLMVAKN